MMRNAFSEADIAAFAPSEKVGLVASLDADGELRVSLLSTLMALGEKGLTIGEFSRGLSKENMATRSRIGFLVMSLDRRLWRGRALWTRKAKEGPEYISYNRQPMFRYNTYFGINTVHYLDLEGVEGPEALPMGGIVAASIATLLKAPRARAGAPVLAPQARTILDKLDSLNFLAYVDAQGWPRILPVLQARSSGPGRIVFTPGPYGKELRTLVPGSRPALFSMNLAMESFLTRGSLQGPDRAGLFSLDLDYLYNSAPPCHGQVYPPRSLEAARES